MCLGLKALPKILRTRLSALMAKLCGSKSGSSRAIHMVSAWANDNQLVLGKVKTDEKSNEITAIPDLLNLLELIPILL